MAKSFEELVQEAAEAPVEGWDFSWLDGRATEERPSWGYQRLLGAKLATAAAALDLQTGGGEVLAGAGAENFPPVLAATEGWRPNLSKAAASLRPLGVVVVAAPEDQGLPFAAGAFDLVTSRHPATVSCAWTSSTSERWCICFAKSSGRCRTSRWSATAPVSWLCMTRSNVTAPSARRCPAPLRGTKVDRRVLTPAAGTRHTCAATVTAVALGSGP